MAMDHIPRVGSTQANFTLSKNVLYSVPVVYYGVWICDPAVDGGDTGFERVPLHFRPERSVTSCSVIIATHIILHRAVSELCRNNF